MQDPIEFESDKLQGSTFQIESIYTRINPKLLDQNGLMNSVYAALVGPFSKHGRTVMVVSDDEYQFCFGSLAQIPGEEYNPRRADGEVDRVLVDESGSLADVADAIFLEKNPILVHRIENGAPAMGMNVEYNTLSVMVGEKIVYSRTETRAVELGKA